MGGLATGALTVWLVTRGPAPALVLPAPPPSPVTSSASPSPTTSPEVSPFTSSSPWAPPPDEAAPLGGRSPSPVPGDSTDAHLDARTLLPPAEVPALNVPSVGDLDRLRARGLLFPVPGFDVHQLRDNFAEKRGDRVHEALDMPAARGTPVVAVDDGRVAKLFTSAAGGLTVYEFDPTGAFCYYYAHLDRYAPGLHDGQPLKKGDVIGFVGTTGNAPPEVPHLHFTIFKLGADGRWWQGTPLDPYPLWAMR